MVSRAWGDIEKVVDVILPRLFAAYSWHCKNHLLLIPVASLVVGFPALNAGLYPPQIDCRTMAVVVRRHAERFPVSSVSE